MIYKFDLKSFPFVTEVTKVVRDTTWEITARFNMLFFIQEGACCFTSNNEVSDVKAGEIYFVPSGTRYKRQPINEEYCTITCIYFKTDEPILAADMTKSINNISEQKNKINESILSGNSDNMFFDTIYLQSKMTPSNFDKLNERIKNINMLSNRRPLMCHLLSSNALCDILIHLSQFTIDSISSNSLLEDSIKIPPKLRYALNYIFQNYSTPISLEHISKYCNVTKQQMIRYFKNSLGTTPTQYILEYKAMKARELLYNYPSLDIKDISMMLGFDDQLYFSRMFKKVTGETPSEFRYRANNHPQTEKAYNN